MLGISAILAIILTITEGGLFLKNYYSIILYLFTNKASQLGASTSFLGDIIRGIVSIMSLIFTGLVIAIISSYFFEKVLRRFSGMEIPKISGHTMICGWNEIGNRIIETITSEDPHTQIVCVCKRESKPFHNNKVLWLNGDFTQEVILKKAYVQTCKFAIILSDIDSVGGNQEYCDWQTILSVLAIENLNSEVYTTAELINPCNREHLEHANVDEIIVRGDFSGNLLSRAINNKGLSKVVRVLIDLSLNPSMFKINLPDNFKVMTYYDLVANLGKTYSATLVAYEDDKNNIIISPPKDQPIKNAKYIFVVSETRPRF
jgi:voltage-gated potassium channel